MGNIVSFGHKESFLYKLATDDMAVQIFYSIVIDIIFATLMYIIIFYCFRNYFFPTDGNNE